MIDNIELYSRKDDYIHLKKLNKLDNSESYTYILKTSIHTIKSGIVDKSKKFIDIPGHSILVEGKYLEEAKAIVKNITYITQKGYIITFEPPKESTLKENEQDLINSIINI